MGSIHARAPSSNVLIVCSKADLVDEATREERVEDVWSVLEGKPYFNQVIGVECVSNKDRTGIDGVREILQGEARPVDDAGGLVNYGKRVPLGWFMFHKATQNLVDGGIKRITLEQAKIVGRECEVEEQDLERMLQEYHNIGFLQWCWEEADARNLVVLDVQWMMDTMTKMLCTRNIVKMKRNRRSRHRDKWARLQSTARFDTVLLPELWQDLEARERDGVLGYMEHFGLCCRLPDAA